MSFSLPKTVFLCEFTCYVQYSFSPYIEGEFTVNRSIDSYRGIFSVLPLNSVGFFLIVIFGFIIQLEIFPAILNVTGHYEIVSLLPNSITPPPQILFSFSIVFCDTNCDIYLLNIYEYYQKILTV